MEESQLPVLANELQEAPEVLSLTPAQARVNAVSNVLQKAYERAGTLQLTPEETKLLMADFPDEAFVTGAGGNDKKIYLEHACLRDRLNEVLGLGQWALVRMRPHWAEEFQYYSAKDRANKTGTRVFAECALIVRGCFCAEATGTMDYYPNQNTNFADAAEGSMTAAFRRCAKQFGVGIQAWRKGFGDGWFERQRQGQRPAQAPPPARPAPAPTVTPPKPYQMKPAAPMKPMVATEKTRQWMLDGLKQFAPEDLLRFAAQDGFPIENLADWPLDRVPTSYAALGDLVRSIEDWMVLNAESLAGPPLEPAEAFWDVMISVPRAGTKRAEYLAAPDTIRSLYLAMKSGDEKAKTRLWGMANEWAPAPYTAPDGRVWQPRPEDHDCRAALDEFLAWEKSKGNLVEEII